MSWLGCLAADGRGWATRPVRVSCPRPPSVSDACGVGEVLREGRAGPGQTTKDPRPGQGLTGEELSLEPGLTRTWVRTREDPGRRPGYD